MTPKNKINKTKCFSIVPIIISQLITVFMKYLNIYDWSIVIVSLLYASLAVFNLKNDKNKSFLTVWYGIFIFFSSCSSELFNILGVSDIPMEINVALFLTLLVAVSTLDRFRNNKPMTKQEMCNMYTALVIIPIWVVLIKVSGMENTIAEIIDAIESFNTIPVVEFFLIQIAKKSITLSFAAILYPILNNSGEFTKSMIKKLKSDIVGVYEGKLFKNCKKIYLTLNNIEGTT